LNRERLRYLLLGGILLAGLALCVTTAIHADKINGANGFPLDDPWIHLQFAKNLHDHGAFSYYKNEMTTSGSTSPIYTLLLAAGFFVTEDEMVLSYCYGVTFFLLAGFVLFKLGLLEFGGDVLYAAGAAFLFLFEPRLLWAALSGMETTLFILLSLAALYYYKARRPVLFGIASGLLLWTRPEALLFMTIIGLDALYHAFVVPRAASRKKSGETRREGLDWLRSAAMIFAGFAILYILFNLVLSGSLFPNTYAAKLKYYTGGGQNYPVQVFHYVTDGHLAIYSVFVAIGILSLLFDAVRRRPLPFLIAFLWSGELFLAYWKNLPYLFQEGRYLMPLLPMVLLLGLSGLRTAVAFITKQVKLHASVAVTALLLVAAALQFAYASWNKRDEYAEVCKYISDRQVRTARWMHDHLPGDAIVATHDVGAIAFYSGRKIVDMVGLISPEMIQHLGNLDGLVGFLNRKHATHIAVLRNWFEVDNREAVFQTDVRHPEIMEVFKYDGSAHILSHDVVQMLQAGEYYLSMNDVQTAGPILQRAAQLDPRSSRAHLFLGGALLSAGKVDDAERELQTALTLHPDFVEAQAAMAEVSVRRNNPLGAIGQLEAIAAAHPYYANAYRRLSELYRDVRHDSAKSAASLQRFNELTNSEGR